MSRQIKPAPTAPADDSLAVAGSPEGTASPSGVKVPRKVTKKPAASKKPATRKKAAGKKAAGKKQAAKKKPAAGKKRKRSKAFADTSKLTPEEARARIAAIYDLETRVEDLREVADVKKADAQSAKRALKKAEEELEQEIRDQRNGAGVLPFDGGAK